MATSNGPSTPDLLVMPAPSRVIAAIRAALAAEVRPAISTEAGVAALREIETLLGYLAACEEPGRVLRARVARQGRALLAEGLHLLSEAGAPGHAASDLAVAGNADANPSGTRVGGAATDPDWPTAGEVEVLLRSLSWLTSALTSAEARDSAGTAQLGGLVRRLAAWESDWYESIDTLTRGQTTMPSSSSAVAPGTGAGGNRRSQRSATTPASGKMSLEGLNAFLPSVLPGYPGGQSLTAISGSSGKRTYKLELDSPWEGQQVLIVRQEPPGFTASWVTVDLRSEAMIVRTVGEAGVPVPRLLTVRPEPSELGAPFAVLEERLGTALGSPYGDGPMSAPSAEMAATLLATVHRVPLTDLSIAGVAGFEPELVQLSRGDHNALYLAELTKLWQESAGRVASPTIERVLDWLRRNLVPDSRPCTLVHGDFGPHNLLAVDGTITALLDWEYAKPGDPAQDLGYAQEAISRHLDWSHFIDAYCKADGAEVSAASIQWTGAASWLRNVIGAMVRIASFNEGSRSDVETPGRVRNLPRLLTKVSGQIEQLPLGGEAE
jgi:aminoglycoside phosphotransferase (APT) family kinase protein